MAETIITIGSSCRCLSGNWVVGMLPSLPLLPTGYDSSSQPGLLSEFEWEVGETLVITQTLPEADDDDGGGDDDDEAAGARAKARKPKTKMELQASLAERDPYKLLELDELRWRASADDIKKAYRRMVLKHHPDKVQGGAAAANGGATGTGEVEGDQEEAGKEAPADDTDEMFKAITEAFELLSDAKRRYQRRG